MRLNLRRSVLSVEIASVLALGAFAAHTVLPDGGSVAHFFDYRLYYAIIVAAAVLTIARAAVSPLHRGAWIAIAVAVTSYATAEFLWLFLYSSSDNAPYPSIADVFYLGFYPASYVGLVLLLRARLRSLTPGVWVDGITAAMAAAAIGSAVLIAVVLDTTDGPPSVVATNIAYPLGDVILLSLVVGGFALTRWHPGRAWAFLGASLTISALADSAYLYATATGTYSEGGVLDAAWPTGLLLIGIAAWQDDGRDRIVDMRGRQLLAIPTLCALVAVTLLIVDHFHRLNLVAITLATLTLAGVLTRLAFTFRENGNLLRRTTDEAITDSLTGLGNRRRLISDLDATMEVATIEEPWLLAIFDLDGFKGYNDAFGHPAGDALLARLGGKLAAATAGHGRCYRLGGDEFCLLTPADATLASPAARRLARGPVRARRGLLGDELVRRHPAPRACERGNRRAARGRRAAVRPEARTPVDARRAARGPAPGAVRARARPPHPCARRHRARRCRRARTRPGRNRDRRATSRGHAPRHREDRHPRRDPASARPAR